MFQTTNQAYVLVTPIWFAVALFLNQQFPYRFFDGSSTDLLISSTYIVIEIEGTTSIEN